MRVLLDNEPCSVSAKSLGEALQAANDIAEGRGRLVVEVLVDGILLSDTQLQEETRLAAGASEVQLRTTTALDLLSETFASASRAVIESEQVQENAAKLIQAGQVVEGMKALSTALATWMEVHEAVIKGLTLAGEDPETLVIDGIKLNDASIGLQDRLGDLRSAISTSDPSAICDCLLYEFPAVSNDWAGLLYGLSRRYDSNATEEDEKES